MVVWCIHSVVLLVAGWLARLAGWLGWLARLAGWLQLVGCCWLAAAMQKKSQLQEVGGHIWLP